MNRKHFTLMLAFLMALSLAACSAAPETAPPSATAPAATAAVTATPAAAEQADQPVTYTDVLGRTVEVQPNPEKIVSLSASSTEILFALGLGDKVIGRDVNSDTPAEAANIEVVGDYNGPNIEAIAALNPDLVLASNKLQRESIDQLEQVGITVAAIEGSTIDQTYQSILDVGLLTGASEEAQALVDQMKADEQAILDKAAQGTGDKPVVYYVMSFGEYGNWTSGPGSFINEMVEKAGGICMTADGGAMWMDYSLEDLVAKDPDILIVASDVDLEALKAANGYKDLTAVKSGAVYPIDVNILSRPGPRIIEALSLVYDALHS